jgi:hypothetical protein
MATTIPIIIYPHIKLWWYRTMLIFCDIVVAILKMATGRNFSMSGINWGHHYLPTYEILMISETMLNFCSIVVAILKMATDRNFWIDSWHWKISTGRHFKNGHHNIAKIQHCPISSQFDMWVDNDVLNWNCSMSGLNSGHHYLPTYQIVMISDNVDFLRYCGGHFENGDR